MVFVAYVQERKKNQTKRCREVLHHYMTGKESLSYRTKGGLLGVVSQTKTRQIGLLPINALRC